MIAKLVTFLSNMTRVAVRPGGFASGVVRLEFAESGEGSASRRCPAARPDRCARTLDVVDRRLREHPEVIAQRITQYAHLVGRERVMAGTDCGFSNIAGMEPVAPTVVWAKFRAMTEGARLASTRLWP
jgi:hypothetical protein